MSRLLLFILPLLIVRTLFAVDVGLDWQNNLEEAKADAKRLKKPIILFLHSRNCFYCPKVIEQVFPDPKLYAFLEKNFVKLAMDTGTGSDSIEEDVTDQAPERFIVSITPAFIFMGPNEEKLARGGKKHMIIYGFWTPQELQKWGEVALHRFKKLYGDKYK